MRLKQGMRSSWQLSSNQLDADAVCHAQVRNWIASLGLCAKEIKPGLTLECLLGINWILGSKEGE